MSRRITRVRPIPTRTWKKNRVVQGRLFVVPSISLHSKTSLVHFRSSSSSREEALSLIRRFFPLFISECPPRVYSVDFNSGQMCARDRILNVERLIWGARARVYICRVGFYG